MKLSQICHAHCPPGGKSNPLDALAPVIVAVVAAVALSVLLVALWHVIVWGCCLFTGTVIGYRLIVRSRRRQRELIAWRSREGVRGAQNRQLSRPQPQAIDGGQHLHLHLPADMDHETAERLSRILRGDR